VLPNTRKRGQSGLFAASPLLASIGVVVASLAYAGSASEVAVPLLGVLGTLLTVLVARLQRDREAGEYLMNLMLLSIGARFLLLALIHTSVGPMVFAPDQISYQQLGDALVRSWQGIGPPPPRLTDTLQIGYPVINAVLVVVFGAARAAPAVVNIFMGTWLAIPIYYMALVIVRGNRAVAGLAAILSVFFPSMMLWSVLNVRDAPTILAVALCVFFTVRFQRKVDLWDAVGAIVFLAVIAFFREYMTVLVGVSAGAGILIGKGRSPMRSLLLGAGIMGVLLLLAHQAGLGTTLTQEPSLQTVQYLRSDLAFGAGSAYGQSANVSTLGGAITFLPIGLTYFLLAPFPWSITSGLQAITLPETLLWYLLVPFVLRGLYLAMRHDARAYTVPLFVLLVVTFAYAMVEGNVGTAYRHRAQILPLVFLFCALGLRDAYAVWAERRAARRERLRHSRRLGSIPIRREPPEHLDRRRS
jgi:hypothetical protein